MRGVVALLVAALVTAGCAVTPKPQPFVLEIAPAEDPVVVRTALPGQRVVFLVTAPGQQIGDRAIELRASVDGAAYDFDDGYLAGGVGVLLRPPRVVELTVIPEPLDGETDERVLTLTVTGTRDGLTASVTRTLPVWREVDGRAEDAVRIRDLFLPWVAAEHPELGIGPATAWSGTIAGAQLLVVSHYTYYSDEWELGISWHVTIAPDDWATPYLRRRFIESAPSVAARIASVSQGTPPLAAAPPRSVVR